MSGRRVAVVGAGISGLVSVKSCLEEGLEPVCFEQHDDIGGIWYMTEEFRPGQNARIYDSLILNTTKGMVCFSDFPFPDTAPPYPTGQEMHGYLRNYAKRFNLLKYIQFNTKVHNVKRSKDYESTGSWDIETEVGGQRTWATFDSVMVCSGFYTTPYFPDIEGLDTFKGTIKHSQTFKSGFEYRNKKILVVGNSNSAGDVAADISRYADKVYLCVGKGTWILPRCQENGIPLDFLLRRIYTMLPLPESFIGRLVAKKANARFDHVKTGLASKLLPPKGAIMVNDEIPMRIQCGRVRICGCVTRFGETYAEFGHGTKLTDLDGVVFATGLQRKISYLDPIVKANEDKLEWYKMVFPVHLPHETLAVIGYFRTQGSVVPIAELQARLATRVFAGKHKLPVESIIRKDIEKWNNFMMRNFDIYRYSFPNVEFRDELAAELGVKPSLTELLNLSPAVAYQYYFGPAFTFHHRLTGPGNWDGAVPACLEAQHSGYATPIRKIPKISSTGKRLKLLAIFTVCLGILFVLIL